MPQCCASCNTVVRSVYAGEIAKLPCVVGNGGGGGGGGLCNYCEASTRAILKVMSLALEMTAALSLPGCAECGDESGKFLALPSVLIHVCYECFML